MTSPSQYKRPRSSSRTPSPRPSKRPGSPFIWKKKLDQQRRRGHRSNHESETQRLQKLQQELEATKHRRAMREAERLTHQESLAQSAREREQAANADWHRSEADFIARQYYSRQAACLENGRGKRIDQLAWWVRLDLLKVNAPWKVKGVDVLLEEGEEKILEGEIEQELELLSKFEKEDKWEQQIKRKWWTLLKEAVRLRIQQGKGGSMMEEVERLVKNTKEDKLQDLEKEVEDQVEENNDDAFWQLSLIKVRLARRMIMLQDLAIELETEREKRIRSLPKEDENGEEMNRNKNGTDREEELVRMEREKGFGSGEAPFTEEVASSKASNLHTEGYKWNDKYRPRKPRYFNRVQTGYAWSRYNRTHYDRDNPPPKMIEGYKFNIFYPDLISEETIPRYSLKKDSSNNETVVITFHSGPPYEDIAFRIVNRTWERSAKKGFRCVFQKGVLQLWFRFQRYRYRR